MRTLTIVFPALLAATALFAQEQVSQPQTAPSGRFFGPMVTGAWQPLAAPRLNVRESAAGAQIVQGVVAQPASPCSVPLLSAKIPDNIHYTIVQAQPNADKVEPMPQARVPAPSCDVPAPR